jgi:SAM-dependent methyltransferase
MNILIVKRQQDLIKSFIKKNQLSCEMVELGCGDGSNLESFSRADLRGYGYDVSEKALDVARNKKINGFAVLKGDLLNLDIAGKDLLLLLLTLEHLENDISALKKINSYLRKDGWFMLSVPAHPKKYSYQDKIAGHYRRYDVNQLRKLLTENGFSVRKIISLGFPLNNIVTNCYNFFLKILGTPTVVQTRNTHLTGIAGYRQHFPAGLRQLSYVIFPVLSLLRKLDAPFLNTNLGTHYLVFAQKYKSVF